MIEVFKQECLQKLQEAIFAYSRANGIVGGYEGSGAAEAGEAGGRVVADSGEGAVQSPAERAIEKTIQSISAQRPPSADLGDIAFPMFQFARIFKKAPNAIAVGVAGILREAGVRAEAASAYINIHLNRTESTKRTMQSILSAGEDYGRSERLAGTRFIVEFSSPNTNKPLHLGHLRNNALGESVARILKANGARVRTVNLINDRGIHICKSMIAYKELNGSGQALGERGQDGRPQSDHFPETPESSGMKPDHFVGKYYSAYTELAARDPAIAERTQEMLRNWELEDPETRRLWKQMNDWTMQGLLETYERCGIRFDEFNFESQTYKRGRENILAGLKAGHFYRDEQGATVVDLEAQKLGTKVLLRSDGTSLYITQDIGTAIHRQEQVGFNAMVYVVANEQDYHFKVLFSVLKTLGYEWADNLHHLSYGMVHLPDGRMKSREGTVVDADNLLDTLQALAMSEIDSKERGETLKNAEKSAEAVALSALNYYLLQVSPQKDMLFNPSESIAFSGNTGPYLQYTGARISSMFRKFADVVADGGSANGAADGGASDSGAGASSGDFADVLPNIDSVDWAVLSEELEWELLMHIAQFPEIIEQAGRLFDPSILANYLHLLAKTFSRFYHEHPVLNCPRRELRDARLYLASAVRSVLRTGLWCLNIPFVEEM